MEYQQRPALASCLGNTETQAKAGHAQIQTNRGKIKITDDNFGVFHWI